MVRKIEFEILRVATAESQPLQTTNYAKLIRSNLKFQLITPSHWKA